MDIGDIVGGAASAFGLGDSVEGIENLLGAAAPLAELAGALAPGLAFVCPPAAVACASIATGFKAAEAAGLVPDPAEQQAKAQSEAVAAERRVTEQREEVAVRDRSDAAPVRDHRDDRRDVRDHREVRDHRGERPEHTVTARSRNYDHLPGLLRLAAILGDKLEAAEQEVERKVDAIDESKASSGSALEAQAAAEQLKILSAAATQVIGAEGEARKNPVSR